MNFTDTPWDQVLGQGLLRFPSSLRVLTHKGVQPLGCVPLSRLLPPWDSVASSHGSDPDPDLEDAWSAEPCLQLTTHRAWLWLGWTPGGEKGFFFFLESWNWGDCLGSGFVLYLPHP